MDKISVIVAAYNREELLKLCLESLTFQTYKNFEVIIADDGSGENVKKIVDSFRDRLNIIHIRQEDHGFRKTLAINKAVRVSSGEKLYFFDADVAAHPKYIDRTKDRIVPGRYIISRAVLLSEKISKMILENHLTARKIFSGKMQAAVIKDGFFGKTRFCTYVFSLSHHLAAFVHSFKKNSNMVGRCWAIHKNDYMLVNGYNNDIQSGAGEDSELDVRLRNAGIQRKLATNEAISLHFPHTKFLFSVNNASVVKEALLSGTTVCANGFEQIKSEEIIVL